MRTCRLTDAILDLSNRGDIILDSFLGSGSTLVAARAIGRCCFGIELDPRYVDVALKRAKAVCGLSAVLESTGETFEGVARRREGKSLVADDDEKRGSQNIKPPANMPTS